jgi:NADPH:quinone reductase-like Zn-dependent oxidoreductase
MYSISSTTCPAKAEPAKALEFSEVMDLSTQRLANGVKRLTDGYAANILVHGLGGNILGQALQILAQVGSLTTLSHAAGPENAIDVTISFGRARASRASCIFPRLPLPGWTLGGPFRSYSDQVGSR